MSYPVPLIFTALALLPSAAAHHNMGSLCSKSSHYQGGHIVLGTGANTTGGNPNSGNTTSGNTTSGGAPTSARDPRTAAAEAAERRMQAVSP